MSTTIRRTIGLCSATLGLLVLTQGAALAAGPQPLPEAACGGGTATASASAPNRTASEAIPHVEHAFPVPVPYCHHFNPTATPPVAP
jgi:hypothetical protein